jgi:phospholipid/cholesterol/gamma-HCH transport system substrate-binding protein
MAKTENNRGVIVGVFLAGGLLILAAVIYSLGGSQKKFVKSVQISAVFDDVQGLKTGNNIWFSGVKIGTVKAIDFTGEHHVLISMNIEEEAQKYIHKDAKAKISSEGFIGNRIVVIYGGTAAAAPVEDGDKLAVEHALTSDEILDTLQANNQNLLAITRQFKVLSEKIGRGEGLVGAVLTDSLLGERFKYTLASLESASRTAAKLSVAANEFTEKMNTKGGLADQLFTDTTVFASLRESVARLNQLTETATGITGEFKKTSERLNATDNAVGVLLNDPDAARRMKNTLINLESGSKKLDEDLEALQHNFLLRGFFKNRNKDQ